MHAATSEPLNICKSVNTAERLRDQNHKDWTGASAVCIKAIEYTVKNMKNLGEEQVAAELFYDVHIPSQSCKIDCAGCVHENTSWKKYQQMAKTDNELRGTKDEEKLLVTDADIAELELDEEFAAIVNRQNAEKAALGTSHAEKMALETAHKAELAAFQRKEEA